jgi:uncharacterized PurR-regulated membrane protein YhhQ (DUF165 family)
VIWSIIYLTAVLSANYTAIWFIPLPVFGLVSFGTLLFGVTFTARDYAHRLGRSRVYTMITVAAVASAVLSFTGPVDWRVITASVTAIVLAEVADTELFEVLRSQRWLVRVAGSNAVSIPLDSVLFNGIAFVGVFALPMLAAIVLGEIIVKFAAGGAVALWRLI